MAAAVIIGWYVLAGPRSDAGGGPVGTFPGPMSIWPEDPFDRSDVLRHEQDRVDGGSDPWRQDADAVVIRFARNVLGWDRIEFNDEGGSPADGPRVRHIRPRCARECVVADGPWTGVTVDRLGQQGSDAIWSVVAVSSERLRLPVALGAIVAAGDLLTVRTELEDDEHAAVGIRYVQRLRGGISIDCGDEFEGGAGIVAAEDTLTVPDPLFDDETCADAGAVGYVFAYTTPRLTVQTGDPLLESASITDLSIVPVRFSQEPVDPSPST